MSVDDENDDETPTDIAESSAAYPTPADSAETTAPALEELIKLCCICGLDVSQKQRSRDRAGRYWCLYCGEFSAAADKSPGMVPCHDCGRTFRQTVMVEHAGVKICPSCNEIYVAEAKHRLLHKAAVTADPELAIRKLIRKMVNGIIILAVLASLFYLYHFGLLYVHPKGWVPFISALYCFGVLAIGMGIAIGIQYLRIEIRKRVRRAEYDRMVQAAANQILALDEEAHTMGVSEPPEPLRKRVERAVARLEATAGAGAAAAGDILKTLAEKGDPTAMVGFLASQRPNTADTVARNREIATISYLQGDLANASSAVTAILLRVQYDQDAMTRQALICFRNGELEQSKKTFRRVVHIAREKKSDIDLAAGYCNLGMLHVMLNEFDDASVRYSQAMAIYKRLSLEDGQADCLLNLGLIAYRKKEKGVEFESYFRRALVIDKRHNRREGMAICCSLLGVILIEKEVPEIKAAEKMLNHAVELNLELGRPGGVATAYGNLGLVRVKRGDYAGARELFLKAQSIYQRINRPKMMAKIQDMLKTVGTLSAAKAARK